MSYQPPPNRVIRYEIATRRDARWVIDFLRADEAEAITAAEELLEEDGVEAVRVVRQRHAPTEIVIETEVFRREAAPRAKPGPTLSATDDSDCWCELLDELYGARSRRTIGQLLRGYLDQLGITPLELLHNHRFAKKLEAAGSLQQGAVHRIAKARAEATGTPIRDCMRALETLVAEANGKARDALAVRAVPRPGPGGIDALVAECRRLAPDAAEQLFWLRHAASRQLEPCSGLGGRLELALAWAEGASDPVALELIDAIAADCLASAALVQELLGPQNDLGRALCVLAEVARGATPVAPSRAPSWFPAIAALLQRHPCLEIRASFLARLYRELIQEKPLVPRGAATDEAKALAALGEALRQDTTAPLSAAPPSSPRWLSAGAGSTSPAASATCRCPPARPRNGCASCSISRRRPTARRASARWPRSSSTPRPACRRRPAPRSPRGSTPPICRPPRAPRSTASGARPLREWFTRPPANSPFSACSRRADAGTRAMAQAAGKSSFNTSLGGRPRKSPAEIQRILQLHELFVRKKGGAPADLTLQNLAGVQMPRINLTGAKFTGANLKGANLRGAILDGCDFFSANLAEADLSEASFVGADLRGVILRGAKMRGAKLPDVDLRAGRLLSGGGAGGGLAFMRTDMGHVDLTRADLSGARLSNVDLDQATLNQADLSGADLTGAVLTRAKLTGTKLQGPRMRDCDLTKANLSGAQMEGAALANANLRDAEVVEADLKDADLRGARVEGANLEGSDFTGAHLARVDFSKAKLEGARMQLEVTSLSVEIQELIEKHRLWAASQGRHGAQADLSGQDFTRINFATSFQRREFRALQPRRREPQRRHPGDGEFPRGAAAQGRAAQVQSRRRHPRGRRFLRRRPLARAPAGRDQASRRLVHRPLWPPTWSAPTLPARCCATLFLRRQPQGQRPQRRRSHRRKSRGRESRRREAPRATLDGAKLPPGIAAP